MSRPQRFALIGLLALAAAGFLAFFLRYVPFVAPSFAAWIGIGLVALGLASVAWPLRRLGIGSRRRGALVLVSGILLAAAGILWPGSVTRVTGPHQRLDDFLPEYQFAEYHEGWARAPRERVAEAVRQVSFADMPAAVFLMRLRALAGGELEPPFVDRRPILELMSQPGTGFLPLDVEDPTEVVYGMVGRPWTQEPPPPVTTPEQFLTFHEPGHIKVAFDIRVVDEGGGVCRVSTETRTLGNDPEARRLFGRYWRLIYPGSSIIRRVWLDAIIARAERPIRP
jgi:hypothetical protein